MCFIVVCTCTHTRTLQVEPHDAIRIFTEDLDEVKAYPRQKVLSHLMKHAPGLTIPYLVSTFNNM